MNERVAALLKAAQEHQELKAALAGAATPQEALRIAAGAGLPLTVEDLADGSHTDASDAELEGAGAVMPVTNPFQCDSCGHCVTLTICPPA